MELSSLQQPVRLSSFYGPLQLWPCPSPLLSQFSNSFTFDLNRGEKWTRRTLCSHCTAWSKLPPGLEPFGGHFLLKWGPHGPWPSLIALPQCEPAFELVTEADTRVQVAPHNTFYHLFTITRTSSFERSASKYVVFFTACWLAIRKICKHPLFPSLYVRQQWSKRAVCSSLQTNHTSNATFQVLVPGLSQCNVGLAVVLCSFCMKKTPISPRGSQLETN